jgi:predicted acyl esterase
MRRLNVVACVLAMACVTVAQSASAAEYQLREVKHVTVTSHDGVVLDGWLSFPTLAPGERAPTILVSLPYYSWLPAPFVDDPSVAGWFGEEMKDLMEEGSVGIPPIHWIRKGYVMANFSVRGTAHSGGCLEWGGLDEQRDQAALIDWLATQPWSSGKVGIGGLSYGAWTAMEAAVHAPPALKAVVSVAPVVNWYEYLFSPQGARHWSGGVLLAPQKAKMGFELGGDPLITAGAIGNRAGCGNIYVAEDTNSTATRERERSFYEERDLSHRLKDVTAPILHSQGYSDLTHVMQDRQLTAGLPANVPFREIRTWLPHQFPNTEALNLPTGERTWEDVVTGWFDHWLKGEGARPAGGVLHRNEQGHWFHSAAWPPPEAASRSVSLQTGEFRSVQGSDSAWLTRVGQVPPEVGGGQSLCTPLSGVVTWVDAPRDLTIAGNPSAELNVTSDQAGGQVGVTLMSVAPDWSCGPPSPSVKWLADGAADLEYDKSPYSPTPFPKRGRTVHIDLSDVTATIPAGHRLAIVVGQNTDHTAAPDRAPLITIGAGSKIKLPVLAGSAGSGRGSRRRQRARRHAEGVRKPAGAAGDKA